MTLDKTPETIRTMFNMIADLQAITPADSEHAEAIKDAISAINSKYPNLEMKYGDDTSDD